MNKVAIRVLYRMLYIIIEQTEELRYHHKSTPAANALDEAHSYLMKVKYILTDFFENP